MMSLGQGKAHAGDAYSLMYPLSTYTVIAARGLQSLEMLGKPDTYVLVTYAGQEHRTKVRLLPPTPTLSLQPNNPPTYPPLPAGG